MITADVFFNGDDCFLVWEMPFTPNCLGVAIHRKLWRSDGKVFDGWLENRTGFEGDENPPHSHKSSTQWPFQRYSWTDHAVGEGDRVEYGIAPVMQTASGPEVGDIQATVGPVTLTAKAGPASAYFNRGILMSQFVARVLKPGWQKKDLLGLKKEVKTKEDDLRTFLMGQLGAKMLSLLQQAADNQWHIYAALYELDDDALIEGLSALGKRAHLVLANGSAKKKGTDGNSRAADLLKSKVDLTRRMLGSEGLGHNKFAVFADKNNKPLMVWTGSTNWASTGLCTQMNNGILLEDPEIAEVYRQQWQLLKDDKRRGRNGSDLHFGEELMESNNQPKSGSSRATGDWTVWFTRTSGGEDLHAAAEVINNAKRAVLFLMFEPGKSGLLQVIQSRLSPVSPTFHEQLYVHGVANTLNATAKQAAVDLVSGGNHRSFNLDLVQPDGIRVDLPGWAAEVTRDDFMLTKGGVVGHAVIHSKVIVVDPFTDPVVITGSHNFSQSASSKNDENLLIIRGNQALAERYVVNIMATYQHYRWRAYVQECAENNTKTWHGLKKSDKWQKRQPEADAEIRFWLSRRRSPVPAVTVEPVGTGRKPSLAPKPRRPRRPTTRKPASQKTH